MKKKYLYLSLFLSIFCFSNSLSAQECDCNGAGDTTPPVLVNIPTGNTFGCSTPIGLGDVTATDNCSANVTVTYTDDRPNIPESGCFDIVINQMWTAVDDCGNSTSVTRVISFDDWNVPFLLTDPTDPFTPNLPEDITISCTDRLPDPAEVQAYTECFQTAEVIYNQVLEQLDCPTNRRFIRTWSSTGPCGYVNTHVQTITIEDTEGPVFNTTPNDITIDCGDEIVEVPPTGTDNCSDELPTPTFTDELIGCDLIQRTWSSIDACGNETIHVQNITLNPDTEAPIFTEFPADITVSCADPDPGPEGMVVVEDNCSGIINPTQEVEFVQIPCGARIEITYTATDDCGNSTSAILNFSIIDSNAPTFSSLPEDLTLNCGDLVPPAAELTALDDCGFQDPDDPRVTIFDAEVTFEETTNVICTNTSIITRTWTTQDACGNENVHVQLITMEDNEAPVLENVPGDLVVTCGDEIPPRNVTAIDNCSENVEAVFSQNIVQGDCPFELTITETWTATDECGNQSSASRTITSIDNEAPVFNNAPENLTVDCEMVPPPATLTATDNCVEEPIVEFEETSVVDGNTTVITRTWTASDACENEATLIQLITFECAPEIEFECPENITVDCTSGGTHVSWNEPTASSDCDIEINTCPDHVPNYISMGEFNGHSYYCSASNSLSWSDARQTAANLGGYLVVINDAAENQFIKNTVLASTVWIGASDANAEGNFIWEGAQSSNYTNWYGNEPNNQDPNYSNGADYAVLVKSDGQWRDRHHYHHYEFIIEIPCGQTGPSITQTAGPANGGEFPVGTTTVTYEFEDGCGAIATCSFDVTVEECPEPEYCETWGNTHYEYINNVSFGDFCNWSGDNGGYADFTALSTNVSTDENYWIYLAPGYHYGSYQSYWKVWIDWNQDGDFYDNDELVTTAISSCGHWYQIHVPDHANPGATRMRVAMAYGCYPSACSNSHYGEVEDYIVFVNPPNQPLVTDVNDGRPEMESTDARRFEQQAGYIKRDEIGDPVYSIAKAVENGKASLSPNPATSQVYVLLENYPSNASIEVYSNNGQLIQKDLKVSNEGSTKINTTHYHNGLYKVIVKVNGEVTETLPLLIAN